MKKNIISNLLIAIGLAFIFSYASHTWYGGLIVGLCYFIISILIINKKH